MTIETRSDPEHLLPSRLPEGDFRSLAHNLPDVVMRLGHDLRILFVNPAIQEMTGLPPAAFVGRTQREAGLPEDVVRPREDAARRAIATGAEQRIECHIVVRDEPRRYHTRMVPERDECGAIVAVLAVSRDVSDLHRATDELRAREAQMAEAQRIAGLAWWDWHIVEGIVLHSPEHNRLFGLDGPPTTSSPAEMLLMYVHPEDKERISAAALAALSGNEPLNWEYRILYPDRSVHWLHSRGEVHRDAAGQAVRVIGVTVDVTERREMERAREAAANEEKMAALGRLAGGVAHDLNQSLALIAGYGEIARAHARQVRPPIAALDEALDVIQRAALDGGEVARRLLTFARTEEEGRPTAIDVGTLLDDVARLTAPRWRNESSYGGTSIELIVDSPPALVIESWVSSLREALTNLIFNAVDALPRGGRIVLSARREGDELIQITVADTGTGMPPEVIARVFEPFFTTKGARGTGLGLPTVRRIVERHGGSIAIDSAPGAGTRIHLYLPRAPVGAAMPRCAEPASSTQPAARALRVLAIDDEPRMTRLIGRVLQNLGHEVATASSGEEALRSIDTRVPDAVICDLSLGAGMNGWDVARAVRARCPGSRFILATGWGARIDPAEARANGVDAIVAKPFVSADLDRALRGDAE